MIGKLNRIRHLKSFLFESSWFMQGFIMVVIVLVELVVMMIIVVMVMIIIIRSVKTVLLDALRRGLL